MSKLHCHIISNTHWDREWRYPFQAYRMALVGMMDDLIQTLETNSDYRAFFLDSQTVILEDYLAIRPEKEKLIKKYVKDDRLQIGPWYTLPDEWACHGEALVRNLLMGHRTGQNYGPISKVGYTPFSNGQVSQLPQIYMGFDINSCFFYRGIGKHIAKSDFIWEGPDGSQVFGFRFGDYARYNYYYLLYRPGLVGHQAIERAYTWKPEEIPYHVANEQSQDRQYGWMNQKLQVHPENIDQGVKDCREFTMADATTNHLLYMMGHDHSYAATEETDLIKEIQNHIDHDKEAIFHSTLAEYLKGFTKDSKVLDVIYGEMRHTLKEGLWTTLMATILSCRTYLKQQNYRVNSKIINIAEPLSAFAWMYGSEYPYKYLEIAWKHILVNQAHDAVGGCSVDRVHEEMLARWGEVDTISDEIARYSMRDLVKKINAEQISKDEMQLTVFNTLPYIRDEIANFIIDIPEFFGTDKFEIQTLEGKKVECQSINCTDYDPTIEGGYELSMQFNVKRYNVKIKAEQMPGLGYRTYKIVPVKTGAVANSDDFIAKSDRELENENLKVEVNENGTLKLTDKNSGRIMNDLCYFEDASEFGDPWKRIPAENETPILSLSCKAESVLLYNGALEGALKIKLSMEIPAEKAAGANERSAEKVQMPVTMIVSLKKGAQMLEVTVHLENRAKDHRLRIMMPSEIKGAEHAYAGGQYDVLKRSIKLPDATGWKEAPYPTNPMWEFVDISDGKNSFAVINDGLIEYEAVDDERRTVAVTLMRCFGKFVYGRPTPGSQCLGSHYYKFAIYPHEGLWNTCSMINRCANLFTPLQAMQSAPTFGNEPAEKSFIEIDKSTISFGAIKQSEDQKYLVLRVWNPLEREEEFTLSTSFEIKKAAILSMEEKEIKKLKVTDKNSIRIEISRKKIMTIGLWK